jgi:hypothetical protein
MPPRPPRDTRKVLSVRQSAAGKLTEQLEPQQRSGLSSHAPD